jgi:Na+/H+ antiporter NhaD/arsenite permease-like protein
MAPLIPPMARELKLDFRPLLILMVLAANSASLLTLVGRSGPIHHRDGHAVGFHVLST